MFEGVYRAKRVMVARGASGIGAFSALDGGCLAA